MKTELKLWITGVLLAFAPCGLLKADPLDNWHVRRLPQSTNDLNGVTYANGLFVAVGRSGIRGEILTSADGVVWTTQDSGTSNRLSAVVYGSGRFVAVGAYPATAVVSTNGAVWMAATNPPSSTEIAFGNGLFIGITRGNGPASPFYSSSDGMNWTGRASGISTGPEDITYGSDRFVVVGRNPFILAVSVWASTNGVDWLASGPLASQSEGLYAVTWGGGLFVAAGFARNLVSADGEHWTQIPGPSYFPHDIAFGDGFFVAVGASNCCFGGPAYVQSSPDGFQWLVRDSGWTNMLNSVAYGNGTFVAVGEGGAILQSDDTRPRLSARVDGDTGALGLSVTGGLVRSHRLQASAELPATNWIDLLAFTNTQPSTSFVDTMATNFSRRFYRVVSP